MEAAVRERKGADWFGQFSGEWGRFPMNPRVVEGCRCPGESFESNGELGGGRKMAGQSVAARGEERETCGCDSDENGRFQAKPKQDKGGR